MRILFLHGWHSVVGGVKPTHLQRAGHEVLTPSLDDDDFDAAVRAAQAEYDAHHPDVIVGSSRGGAVAMNIASGTTPLVLLCPAWKNWGAATAVKRNSAILHSRADDVIPFADSLELVAASGLPPETLIEVGGDHRLADPESLQAMLRACERLVRSGECSDLGGTDRTVGLLGLVRHEQNRPSSRMGHLSFESALAQVGIDKSQPFCEWVGVIELEQEGRCHQQESNGVIEIGVHCFRDESHGKLSCGKRKPRMAEYREADRPTTSAGCWQQGPQSLRLRRR